MDSNYEYPSRSILYIIAYFLNEATKVSLKNQVYQGCQRV